MRADKIAILSKVNEGKISPVEAIVFSKNSNTGPILKNSKLLVVKGSALMISTTMVKKKNSVNCSTVPFRL